MFNSNPDRFRKQIDIEKLLSWAFLDELCKGGAEAYSPWTKVNLGTRVDDQFGAISRLPPIFGDPHPDAITVGRAVSKLEPQASALVMHHAILGDRPQPIMGPIRVLPIRDGSKPRVVGQRYGQNRFRVPYYHEGSYCPLRFEPSVAEVEVSRLEWATWRGALALLVKALKGALLGCEAIGPSVPLRPWDEPMVVRRVLYA